MRLPPLTPVAAVSLPVVGALWCALSRFVPESPVQTAITAIRGAVAMDGASFSLRLSLDRERCRVRALLRAATWRDRSSIFCRRLAESRVWAIDAVMRNGATSAILSASCEVASMSLSTWIAMKVWMWGASLLDHMLLRMSSAKSGARLFRCRGIRRLPSGAGGRVDHGTTMGCALARS